jgi:hypothetical protein
MIIRYSILPALSIAQPPYSLDYNPIELAFSAIKANIRCRGSTFRSLSLDSNDFNTFVALQQSVFTVTEQDARSWFHKCGYLYMFFFLWNVQYLQVD